jgi:hypothetical protein
VTDAPAIATPPRAAASGIPSPPAVPALELLTAPPALPPVATVVAATVIAQDRDGAFMLRSAYGMLTLKSAMPLPAGARLELRIQPGSPPSVSLLAMDEARATDPPPWQLDLGTTTAATVVTPAADAPDMQAGTRLMLRIVAPAQAGEPAPLAGEIVANLGGETLVATVLGTLALDLPLALPPGTALAFSRLGTVPDTPAAKPQPSEAAFQSSLDQVVAVLDKAAPALAAQLRAALTPGTPAALTGTLLFLMGALYQGAWPGAMVDRALDAAGEKRLAQRLRGELGDLARLRASGATGPWRVSVLPLFAGADIQPLRLYLRRRGGADATDDADTRFVIEAELSRLGALQLDGFVRGARLDVVLRSHAPLDPALQQEVAALFRQASTAQGLHGDIVFAATPQFDVRPLEAVRPHIAVQA